MMARTAIARWDEDSDLCNPGWVIDIQENGCTYTVAPSPEHYNLPNNATQSQKDEMATATLRWEQSTVFD